jgi:hypothetical protein
LTNIPEPEREEVRRKMGPVVVGERDVEKKIQKLRKDAAPGPDGIKPSLLQQFSCSLITPLTIIFKKFLKTGEVPEGCKKEKLPQLLKKGLKAAQGTIDPSH